MGRKKKTSECGVEWPESTRHTCVLPSGHAGGHVTSNGITWSTEPETRTETRTGCYEQPGKIGATFAVVAATTGPIDVTSLPRKIDGIPMIVGDLFLAKDQPDASNDVWVWTGAGKAVGYAIGLPKPYAIRVMFGAANADKWFTLYEDGRVVQDLRPDHTDERCHDRSMLIWGKTHFCTLPLNHSGEHQSADGTRWIHSDEFPPPTPVQQVRGRNKIAIAWHDVTCPEAEDCPDRWLHATGMPLVSTGVLERFLDRMAELSGYELKPTPPRGFWG